MLLRRAVLACVNERMHKRFNRTCQIFDILLLANMPYQESPMRLAAAAVLSAVAVVGCLR